MEHYENACWWKLFDLLPKSYGAHEEETLLFLNPLFVYLSQFFVISSFLQLIRFVPNVRVRRQYS